MKSFVLYLIFFALFGGFGLRCVWWAIVTFTRGEYLTVVAMLAAGLCSFGLIASLTIIKAGKVTARGEFDAVGTTLRPDRAVDMLFRGSALVSYIAMGLYAIFAPFGKMDIPLPPGLGQIYFVVVSAAGVLFGVPTLWRMSARGGMSYLRLTANDFELGQGLSSMYGDWDDVEEVADRLPRSSQPVRGTIVMVMSEGRPRTLAADSYTPGGHALRQLVRFYWQHPEHRSELTDGQALGRLRNEHFEVE